MILLYALVANGPTCFTRFALLALRGGQTGRFPRGYEHKSHEEKILATLLRGLAGRSASRVTQLTVSQLNNYNRFKRKLSTGAGKITIEKIRGGGRRFSADVPARNIPGSFARYIKDVDAGGRTLRYVKETYDAHGRIVHVKPKF